MTNVYIKVGVNFNDILLISSGWTSETQTQVVLDGDTVDFSKFKGYVAYAGDDGKNHLKFDQEKYNAYIKGQQKQEAMEEGQKMQVELQQLVVLSAATDDQAFIMRYLYPEWSGESVSYKKNDRFMYHDKFYKVLQSHTSQADWTPDAASSLYVEIANPAEEWPEFKQPTGAHDAYTKDAKVTFEGKHYKSLIDANVYSPTDYPQGWELVE